MLFDLLYISTDHQEAQTHFGIKGSAGCAYPCVLCEMPRVAMGSGDLEEHRDATQRSTQGHRDVQHNMTMEMSKLIAKKQRLGQEVNANAVAASVERKLGAAKSMRMGYLAWEGMWGVEEDGDDALFQLCGVDALHTVEEGLVKHMRACMLQYLQTKFQASWQTKAQELDRRIQACANQLRWPGWTMRRNRWFFFNDEPYTATELMAIRMVRSLGGGWAYKKVQNNLA